MVDGYQKLYRSLLTNFGIAHRIRSKMRWMRAPVYRGQYGTGERLRILARLLVRGILPGGPLRWIAFLSTLPLSPRQFPAVVADWITGLSMRSFIQRRFDAPAGVLAATDRRARKLVRALAQYRREGSVGLVWGKDPRHLEISLTERLDSRFFRRVAPRLERLLRDGHATLALRIETLRAQNLP